MIPGGWALAVLAASATVSVVGLAGAAAAGNRKCPAPYSDLRGANLIAADLSGCDLREVRLQGAKLYGAKMIRARVGVRNLRGAHLYGAHLSGTGIKCAQLGHRKRSSGLRSKVEVCGRPVD